MEDFNELGLMYYAAVDSRNKSLALELLAQIIAKLNEDDRIVNLFSKLEISDHEKQDVLADINSEIWSNSLSRTTKRWDSKKMTFDSWILIMGDHIARNHSIALETKKIRKKLKKRRALTNSDKLVNRNLEEIKKRESERKTKENPKFKVFGGLGKPQVNRSELLSTTETELNQSNLNKLLQDFTFIFPNSFIQKTENNPMQIWGIPIRDEDAENNGLLIVVQKLKPQFDCLRKFKAIIIAKQPSGNYKTLENNGSKTIYASELETNSVCTLTIILEKPKAVAVVDDWNSIDTSNLQIEKILRTIFGTGHNSELPKLDAPGHLTLNQPAKNQSIIFYEFSFPLAMAAAGKDDSGNDWVYGESESFDGCYGKVQASIDIFQPNNTRWLKISTSVEFPQEMVAVFLGDELNKPCFFVGLQNQVGRICIDHLLVLNLVHKDFLVNPKYQLRPFAIEEMGSSRLKDKMYASYKSVTQQRHLAFDRYLGLNNDAR